MGNQRRRLDLCGGMLRFLSVWVDLAMRHGDGHHVPV